MEVAHFLNRDSFFFGFLFELWLRAVTLNAFQTHLCVQIMGLQMVSNRIFGIKFYSKLYDFVMIVQEIVQRNMATPLHVVQNEVDTDWGDGTVIK